MPSAASLPSFPVCALKQSRTNTEWTSTTTSDRPNQLQPGAGNYHYGRLPLAEAMLSCASSIRSSENSTNCALHAQTTSASGCKFDQFRVLLGYGQLNKRGLSAATVSVSTRTSFVAVCHRANQLQLGCCGLSLEYAASPWEPFERE